jgi:hypothetical protein
MPCVAHIVVQDNSAEPASDGTVPNPVRALEMEDGELLLPKSNDFQALHSAPEWGRSTLESALRSGAAL